MDAIELLTQQHREVDRLFARLEGARKAEQSKLFEELSRMLRRHAFIEEEIFYERARRAETEDTVSDALDDHEMVEELLLSIEETGVAHQSFFSKVTSLRDNVRAHVKMEETELLPQVRALLGEDDLRTLGREMLEAWEEWDEEDQGETAQLDPTPQTLAHSPLE
jgi:hemerythrin-like domain-containing protein